jgi:XTP/dITP diphosphohydrolase
MSGGRPRLLVATFNPGKARELRRLLAAAGIESLTLSDLGLGAPFEETGTTYEENARGKAEHYAAQSGMPALADDSGLEVEALGGGPGVLSARYGGAGLDDAGRCRLLLQELAGLPEERRAARYVAVAALAPGPQGPRLAGPRPPSLPQPGDPGADATRLFRATCPGRIATEMRGERGFGYDPIFFYPSFGATFGEIPDDRKDRVSHRALAFASVAAFLKTPEGLAFMGA